ncbi:MAG: hypothetical protein ACOYVK_18045 [Bacillota bacterium]
MRKWAFIFFILVVFVISSCDKSEKLPLNIKGQNSNKVVAPDNSNQEGNNLSMENDDDMDDFSIKIGEAKVSLMDWDYEMNLEDLFGKPIQEEIQQLGTGSDTFEGSYIKKLKFPRIEFELFSPKDNGKSFFILRMEVEDPKYQTARGVKVGDSLEELRKTYPEIKPILDGREDINNRGYMIEEGAYNYITFEVQQGIIIKIKIYHEFP